MISEILAVIATSASLRSVEMGQSTEQRLIVPPAQVLSALGGCGSGADTLDLQWALWIRNSQVRIMRNGGPTYLRIVRDTVSVSLEEDFGRRELISIPEFLHENGVPGARGLDVQLEFVVINSKVALFWRETYRNRFYQQGLIDLTEQGLSLRCTGSGGGVSMQ